MDQLKVMQASGMYVGSHGMSHCWLSAVDETTQRSEIEKSLEFLRAIGSPVDDYWVMCYPYGGWNPQLLSLLKEYQCTLGLTTEVAKALVGEHDSLLLPRFDTNDFPVPNDLNAVKLSLL
jgi:peptidoglycan/xylan/chitin deacetylase (PgdA/CDA1 family)